MLTYIEVSIENDQYEGGISISSAALVEELGDANRLLINRKTGTSSWEEVYSKELADVSDLNFKLLDITALSGTAYSYDIEIMEDDSPIEFQLYEDINSYFEGLFVGDFNKHYVAGVNFSTEVKLNTAAEFVNTLSGRYPYRISNADWHYYTGESEGLFLELTDDRKSFKPDTYHKYSNEVIEFLSNNEPKLLKTHDGRMWYVGIGETLSKPYSEFMGNNSIQFEWQEIGEVPPFGMVVVE